MTSLINWCNSNQGFLSAILSILTIVIALFVPIRIMHRQNDVSLFEKRYVAYSAFLKIKNFADSIRRFDFHNQDPLILKRMFIHHFEELLGAIDQHDNETAFGSMCLIIKKYEIDMHMLPFLVMHTNEELEKCNKDITNIFEPLLLLQASVMYSLDKEIDPTKELEDFLINVDDFSGKYANLVEKHLFQGKSIYLKVLIK